jgi:hypothetical protein
MTESPGPSEHVRPDLRAHLPIGVLACDVYILRYAACEERLKPEILSGRRRFAVDEAARLKYLRTELRDPGLADACKQMLEQLRPHCGDERVTSP